jgi:rhamnosyltransferase
MTNVGIVIPTLNAGPTWTRWLTAFDSQTYKPASRLVIDSSSTDGTARQAQTHGFQVRSISRAAFNHGGTRQWGVELLKDADIIVFATQDALFASPEAISRLIACFEDERVGAAYGRQLPHENAGPIGAHARLFNYPYRSAVLELRDRARLGIKVAFLSNSFAAYRRSALLSIGGFPTDTIMNEDTYVAGKLLLSNWKIAYSAEATVRHSHDYRYRDEFRRYFDIGVFHARERWLRENFGDAAKEGRRFVISELHYLALHAPWLMPSAVMRTALKWLGYNLGLRERMVSSQIKRRLSLHRSYWSTVDNHPSIDTVSSRQAGAQGN